MEDTARDVSGPAEAAAALVEHSEAAIDGLGILARIVVEDGAATLAGNSECGEVTLSCPWNGDALSFARELARALDDHMAEASVPRRQDDTESGGTQTLMHVRSRL